MTDSDIAPKFGGAVHENTYGAHHLVDFRPINDADKLLEECEAFVQQAKVISTPLIFPAMEKWRQWRVKKRDQKLMQTYENLYPRILDSEKVLRGILGDVVEKKAALRSQARYLLVRLESCIEYNRKAMGPTIVPIDELRNLLNTLSAESAMIKSMIQFNKEILRIRNVEQISKGRSFIRWGNKPAIQRGSAIPETELLKDADHPAMSSRLQSLRQLRDTCTTVLATVLESRGSQLANLDNCERSLQAIHALMKRGGVAADSAEEPPIAPFDHARCTDCSYAFSITCDCTNHLAALQTQVSEANRRLQSLVEMRERMCEAAENLDVTADVGYRGSSFSSFTNRDFHTKSPSLENSQSNQPETIAEGSADT